MWFKSKLILLVTAIALLLTFTLSACGARNPDILTVGMEVGYPPMEMLADDGKTVVGFDVDMAKELAKRMGKKDIEIVSSAFDGILPGLETNKFDCGISSISIKPERQAAHSLTKAYIANKLVLVTKKGDTSIKSPDDLVGKKVGVQGATTSEDYIKDLISKGKKIDYSPYQKVTQPFADLKIGRIDAVMVDIVVAGYYTLQDKDSFNTAWESPDAEPYGIAFPKKDTAMRDKANKILDDMQADGTMAAISAKWFGKDITKNLQ